MSMSREQLLEWGQALPPKSTVFIDEGGLTLCSDRGDYLEIGGKPEDEDEEGVDIRRPGRGRGLMPHCDFFMVSSCGQSTYAPCPKKGRFRVYYRYHSSPELIKDWRRYCERHAKQYVETLQALSCIAEVEIREEEPGRQIVAEPLAKGKKK